MMKAKLGAIGLAAVVCAGSAGAQQAPVVFDDIQVVGNQRMSGAEVLGLCDIDPAASYTETRLQAMVACLGNSGAFTAVNLTTEGRVLLINVDEAPQYTGLLDISVSADTDRGISSRLYIEDRDLFSSSYVGSFEVEVAQEEQTATAGISRTNFWAEGYSGGVVLDYRNRNYDDQTFSYRSATLAPFVLVPLPDNQSLRFRLGVKADEVYDIDVAASPILKREVGDQTFALAGIDYRLAYSPGESQRTNFTLDASQYFYASEADNSYGVTQLRGGIVTSVIPERLNLSFEIEGGHLAMLGDRTSRSVDRFNLGGTSLRGFAPRGVGPRDGSDALGGDSFAAISVETRSPIASIGTFDIAGGVFFDAGSVWDLDDVAGAMGAVDGTAQIRTSAGLSLTAQVGDLPISLYYAEPLKSVEGDSVQEFGLSVSTQF